MNQLSIEKRTQIIILLVEGNSLRSTSRIADVSINTVTKLLVSVGKACQKFQNEQVVNVRTKRVQCVEIWSFEYDKEKNKPDNMEGAWDVWTWTAIDSDSKLIISWLVGEKDAYTAYVFMNDVADRLATRIQLTNDGLKAYLEAVGETFGNRIDFAQLVKMYGNESATTNKEKKYSPAECTGMKVNLVSGNPDHISISPSERQNLTMRMHMRRFARLTNAFSKKLVNHCHAIALHFVYYNFVKIHKSLRVPPSMEAGLIKKLMTIEDIVRLVK